MTTITSTAPTTITANIWPNIIDGRDIVGGGEEVLRDSPAHEVRVASYPQRQRGRGRRRRHRSPQGLQRR